MVRERTDAEPELDAVGRAQTRVGQVLKEKWTIECLLGVGGMAAVYKAVHRNGNEVAVKMLHPEISVHAGIRDRFLREGYVGNKVKHEGAVTVFDDDVTEDGSAFLVMELLEGESLEGLRERRGGRVPADEVLLLAHRLLDVLTAAHENGIVHRDLKPENVFLTREGVVKVLDFGIARVRELSSKSSATQTGSIMGTPAFMAPEQARGRWNDVDARTDLWAVGATMFTLLTGKYVHEAETVTEAVAMAITQQARSIASVDRDAHPAIVALIDRALAYQRDQRWPDARAMQAASQSAYEVITGAPAQATPSGVSFAHGQTVAAPSHVISQITASAPAATAASGLTASLARPGTSRTPVVAGAIALAVAVAIVVAVVALRGSNSEAYQPAAAAGPEALEVSRALAAAEVRPTVEPAAQAALSPSALPVEPPTSTRTTAGERRRAPPPPSLPAPLAAPAPVPAKASPPPKADEDIMRQRR